MKVGALIFPDLAQRICQLYGETAEPLRVIDVAKTLHVKDRSKRQFMVRFIRGLVKAGGLTIVDDGRKMDRYYKCLSVSTLHNQWQEIQMWKDGQARKLTGKKPRKPRKPRKRNEVAEALYGDDPRMQREPRQEVVGFTSLGDILQEVFARLDAIERFLGVTRTTREG